MQTLLPVASATLALISPVVYGISIVRGESKPHRTTRFVLLIITLLTAGAIFAQNNTTALWLAAASAIQSIIIFVLSLKYGMGGKSPLDIFCLIIAVIGIILWQATANPLLALYSALLADFTGMIPALLKTYKFPETENWLFYALDSIAGLLILIALTTWNFETIAYPIYILLINAAMTALARRNR